MRKSVISLCIVMLLCIFTAVPVFADTVPDEHFLPRLVDDADLLSDSEEAQLTEKLDEISIRHQMDIVIVTNYSLDGKTPTRYADDFYDDNGYGFGVNSDGILLLLSMEERDWAISTCGLGIDVFTDAGQIYITEIAPYFSDGEYYEGFDMFASLCDEFINQAVSEGEPYDIGNMDNLTHKPLSPIWILTSILVGAVVALIAVMIMKSQLKSVRYQTAANQYVKPGSMKLRTNYDMFLYRNVTRTRIESDSNSGGSSTHTSSSGASHGGSSGKF